MKILTVSLDCVLLSGPVMTNQKKNELVKTVFTSLILRCLLILVGYNIIISVYKKKCSITHKQAIKILTFNFILKMIYETMTKQEIRTYFSTKLFRFR